MSGSGETRLRQRDPKTLYDQPHPPRFVGPWRIGQRDNEGRILSWSRSEALPNEHGIPWYRYHQFCPQANAYTHGGGYGTWCSADPDAVAWKRYFDGSDAS